MSFIMVVGKDKTWIPVALNECQGLHDAVSEITQIICAAVRGQQKYESLAPGGRKVGEK